MLFSNLLLLAGMGVSSVSAKSIPEFLHRESAFFFVYLQFLFETGSSMEAIWSST